MDLGDSLGVVTTNTTDAEYCTYNKRSHRGGYNVLVQLNHFIIIFYNPTQPTNHLYSSLDEFSI